MGEGVTSREILRDLSTKMDILVSKVTAMETHHLYTKEDIADHKKRIGSLETSDRNQKFITGTIAAIAGAISGFAHKFFH